MLKTKGKLFSRSGQLPSQQDFSRFLRTVRSAILRPRVVTVICGLTLGFAIAGPFPIYGSLGLPQRIQIAVAWTSVNTLMMLLTAPYFSILFFRAGLHVFGSVALCAILSSALVNVVGFMWFYTFTATWSSFAYWTIAGALVLLLCSAPIYFMHEPLFMSQLEAMLPSRNQTEDAHIQLQKLLPHDKRGTILRMMANEKYTIIETTKGRHILRIPFGEAARKVPPGKGHQVHRSHWVRYDNIKEIIYQNGNPKLLLKNGKVIPLSRKSVSLVRSRLADAEIDELP